MTHSQLGERMQKAEPIVISNAGLKNVPWEQFHGTSNGDVTWKTLLSAPTTKSDTFTVGIASCRPNGGNLALHRHLQPEIYHVISGSGIVRVDDQDHRVSAGDVVFIPGNSEHGVINEHEHEDFKWLYCFNADRFEDVVYEFTKVGEAQTIGTDIPTDILPAYL